MTSFGWFLNMAEVGWWMQGDIVKLGDIGVLQGIALQQNIGVGLDTGLLEDIQVLEQEDNSALEEDIL